MINEFSVNTERSILFHLEPIGIGTPFVESLTGYISRLSMRHGMSTGKLFSSFVSPELNKMYLFVIAENGGSGFYEKSSMINGIGDGARDCVKAIGYLTKRPDIAYTTLIPWSTVIPRRGLIRVDRVWCPECYHDWQIDGHELYVYDPLIWSLQAVKICPIHQIKLVDICPNCGKKQRLLDRTTIPGFCSKCGNWLGKKQTVHLPIEEIELKIALKAGEMLAASNAITPIQDALVDFFEKCVELIANGNAAQFANIVGVPKSTYFGWHRGKNLSPLREFLSICSLLNVSPVKILTGQEYNLKSPSLVVNRQLVQRQKIKVTYRLKENLENVANSDKILPLCTVAKELDTNTKTLRKHYPDLCDNIAKKYKRHRNKLHQERIKRLKTEIDTATKLLFQSGVYPSRRQVEAIVENGCLKEKPLQQFWKDKLIQYYQISI